MRVLEPPSLLIFGEIPNYKINWAVLSSYFVVLLKDFKLASNLKLMQFEIFKSHTLI